MSDLIERLRGGVPATAQIFGGFTFDMQATVYLLSEAATALAEAEAEITRLRGESRALRAMIRVNLLRYGPSDLTHQEIDREIEIAVNPPPLDAKTPAKG